MPCTNEGHEATDDDDLFVDDPEDLVLPHNNITSHNM